MREHTFGVIVDSRSHKKGAPNVERELMLKRIVVPVDGSQFSARAVPAAAAIGHASGAVVKLVGVVTEGVDVESMLVRLYDAGRLLPEGIDFEEEVVERDDPVAALLEQADDPATVLCLASHDHRPPAASIRHSVGSLVIERAVRPLLVVGPNAEGTALRSDVVVALDGQHDPAPLLWPAAGWAGALDAPLRIVTVFEPVPSDIRRPEHYTRKHGPSSDPTAYLEGVRAKLRAVGLRQVDVAAVPDPVAVATGLAEHLAAQPALLLVVGGRPGGMHLWPGVVRELVRTVRIPLLVIPSPVKAHAWTSDAEAAGIDVGPQY